MGVEDHEKVVRVGADRGRDGPVLSRQSGDRDGGDASRLRVGSYGDATDGPATSEHRRSVVASERLSEFCHRSALVEPSGARQPRSA